MAFDRIQFDPNSMPLRSDLRVLATIRTLGEADISIYLDSNGEKQGIRRSVYISEINEPGLFKRDEVSVVSNWPRFGGPHIVVLPEGQRLLLGELAQGTTVEVALWRTFIMAQTFSNRILVAATPDGISAFQPKPGSVTTPKPESSYTSITQERDVLRILDSVAVKPIVPPVPVVAEIQVSPSYIEVAPKSIDIPKLPNEIGEIQPEIEVDSLPEPPALIAAKKTRTRKSVKLMILVSDLLITFAIFAIMYAGYQTVWSSHISQQRVSEATAEVELKWKEAPAAAPELHKGFALIYIPRLQDKVWKLPITNGVSPDDLSSGVGHYPETAMPGEKGNFALAGHRSTYGEPLANIDQLKQDDEVIIQTAGNWYVYKLVLDEIVEPDAMWVLDPNPGGIVNKTGVEEMITLTTCHPRWGSTERWIWWGVLTEVLPYDQVPAAITAAQEGTVEPEGAVQ